MAILDLLELPAATPAYSPLVGLDLGEKTIGVAVSDTTRTVASPLELIRKTKFTDDANALFKLMESRNAGGIVIGLLDARRLQVARSRVAATATAAGNQSHRRRDRSEPAGESHFRNHCVPKKKAAILQAATRECPQAGLRAPEAAGLQRLLG